MRHKSGYLLLELMIAISLMAVCIPSMLSTYFLIQKKSVTIHQTLKTNTDFLYLFQFIRSDLKKTYQIDTISPSLIQFKTTPHETIAYELVGKGLRRKLTRLNGETISTHIMYLASQEEIQLFNPALITPRLLEITIALPPLNRTFRVFLPNISS